MTKQKAGQSNKNLTPGFCHTKNVTGQNDTKHLSQPAACCSTSHCDCEYKSRLDKSRTTENSGVNAKNFTSGGIILLHKPRGLSSNSAVNIVKRAVGAKKAGHLGTLDVEAEGLLPITLNSATKLFDMFLHKDKEYLTTIKFGEERDTFDLEGEITRTDDKIITADQIKSALPSLIGTQMQMPPAYSAKKIDGRKAYDLAREGKQPSLTPKQVTVYDFSLVRQVGENLYVFKIACSSGTYVRALCRDLAQKLSTCAVCYDIIRTRCGIFDLNYAHSLEDVKSSKFTMICPDALFDFEKISLPQADIDKLLNGQLLKSNLINIEYVDPETVEKSNLTSVRYLNSRIAEGTNLPSIDGKLQISNLPDGDYRLYNEQNSHYSLPISEQNSQRDKFAGANSEGNLKSKQIGAHDSQSGQFIGICNVKNGLLKLALRLN